MQGSLKDLISSKALSLLVSLLVILAIPFTVYLVQKQQDIRQKAQESSIDQVQSLTNQLLQVKNEYEQTQAGGVSQTEKLNNLVSIAANRKETLIKEAEATPEAFLRHATLASQRSSFPQEAQELIEQEIETQGELNIIHQDDFDNQKSKIIHALKTPEKIYNLHFVKTPPGLVSSSTVSIKGIALVQELVLQGGEENIGIQIIKWFPVLSPLGDQRTLVFLFNFQNDPNNKPTTSDYIYSLMFTADNSVNKFYQENSFNKTWFSGDVAGWYTVSYESDTYCSGYDEGKAWNQVENMARGEGINVDSYPRRVYAHPFYKDCRTSATLGGNPSAIEMNGDWGYLFVWTHEFGHNLGLLHANSIRCGDKTIDVYSKCRFEEYGDHYSVMGSPGDYRGWYRPFHNNGDHKVFLKWIEASNILEVDRSVIVTIEPLEYQTSGLQVLKVRKPDTNEYYFVDYRRQVGFDDILPPSIVEGVLIHIRRFVNNPPETYLIDSTPATPDHYDEALSDGAEFFDEINGIRVRQISHDANSVTVEITLPAPTPTPTLTPTPIPTPTTTPFVCTACAADVNRDGTVNILDLSAMGTCFNQKVSDKCPATLDINNDGLIDMSDLECARTFFGQTCSLVTPTPSPTPTPTPAPLDSDGDGFLDNVELFIGTDPMKACPISLTDNAWPPDVDNNRRVDIFDLSKMAGYVNNTRPYDRRYDLDISGSITSADLEIARPYFLKSCTP